MSNTGNKGWTNLEEYYTDNGAATGVTKANSGADYIAPVYDLSSCPLPDITKPTACGPLSLMMVTTTTMMIGWSAATDNVGVVSYDVLIMTKGGFNVTELSYTATGLIPATEYEVHVWANDAAGNRGPGTVGYFSTNIEFNTALTVMPYSAAPFPGGGECIFSITSNYNELSFDTSESWVSLSYTGTEFNIELSVYADANYGGYTRSAEIYIRHSGSVIATVSVQQDPYY